MGMRLGWPTPRVGRCGLGGVNGHVKEFEKVKQGGPPCTIDATVICYNQAQLYVLVTIPDDGGTSCLSTSSSLDIPVVEHCSEVFYYDNKRLQPTIAAPDITTDA